MSLRSVTERVVALNIEWFELLERRFRSSCPRPDSR